MDKTEAIRKLSGLYLKCQHKGKSYCHGPSKVVNYSEGGTYAILACGCALLVNEMPIWEQKAFEVFKESVEKRVSYENTQEFTRREIEYANKQDN